MINFLNSNYPLWAITLLLVTPATHATTWYALEVQGSVSSGSTVSVEVDIESIRSFGEKRELNTRISFSQPQKEQSISFQSVIAELVISCDSNQDIWKNVSFFLNSSAEGKPISSANFGTTGLHISLLKILPEKTWALLQKSACGRNTTVAP